MRELGLTKKDWKDIGFVTSSLSCGAVTWEEFKDWFWWLIENYPSEKIPFMHAKFHYLILCVIMGLESVNFLDLLPALVPQRTNGTLYMESDICGVFQVSLNRPQVRTPHRAKLRLQH